jgi:spermidine/putrescine transport system permease protein
MALLPLLVPAFIASAIMVFAISMDDFVVSAFLSSGSGTDTVPVRIYSNARGAPTPALNALASLTLVVTLVIAVAALVVWQIARNRRGQTGSGVDELAV